MISRETTTVHLFEQWNSRLCLEAEVNTIETLPARRSYEKLCVHRVPATNQCNLASHPIHSLTTGSQPTSSTATVQDTASHRPSVTLLKLGTDNSSNDNTGPFECTSPSIIEDFIEMDL